ncbi:HAMP domain-containing sensor histidine kinase [Nocardia sp. NPDC051030]|uniref:HAMP domain-containing sensor histidine kinase n=1 Tax=Nocardia sp. NPDC051030 TaxID=3155162 RepID=UPI00343BFA53
MVDLSIVLRPSRWGLRVRSAVFSTLVLAVVFGIGGVVALVLMYRSLIGSLETSADERAGELVQQLGKQAPGQLDNALFDVDDTLTAIQVIAPDGTVVRGSAGKADVPLMNPVPMRARGLEVGGADGLRVTTVPVTGGGYTVLVAVSDEQAEETVRNVALVLGVVAPVVLLTSGVATFALVGRSLASVDAIRRQVAAIGADRLGDRVPVPATRDEIAQLAVTMNAMLDRIQAGRDAQRRFVADASHELRSPLSTVIAALELGRDHPDFLDSATITGSVLPEAERIRYLVEDLLTLASADESRLRVTPEDVDIDDLVAAAVTALRHNHPALRVEARVVAARVAGDPRALHRLIRNLADNAAAHAITRVSVAIEDAGESIRVIVDDDGPGIPVADRERVFERFVRLQDDRGRDSGGTGLGLAIVAELVRAHAGTVSIGESPYGGARFVVLLPKRFAGRSSSASR